MKKQGHARLGKKPAIGKKVQIKNVHLGRWTEVGEHSYLENVHMDDYSYSGPFCFMQNARIGKFSNIAASVRLGPTNHPLDRATLHHFTYRRTAYDFDIVDDVLFFRHRAEQITTVGHDTWIGHGVIVMPGITIGNGAVIGSGAVVTKDVPPWTIVAGVPAKIIRRRFDGELSSTLEAIAWWDWSHELIKERIGDFCESAGVFAEKYDPRGTYRMIPAMKRTEL
jgi:phosphonate metabolism protein (transferase hexapeptide repeat family)